MRKQFIIVRGLPGSGKTSFAESLADPAHICGNDEFLYTPEGEYVYTPARLEAAQLQAYKKFLDLIRRGVSPIFFTGVAPNGAGCVKYVAEAEMAGYRVVWLVVENRHGGVSEHNVPRETLYSMRANFRISL